jgi:hypothetical protein
MSNEPREQTIQKEILAWLDAICPHKDPKEAATWKLGFLVGHLSMEYKNDPINHRNFALKCKAYKERNE